MAHSRVACSTVGRHGQKHARQAPPGHPLQGLGRQQRIGVGALARFERAICRHKLTLPLTLTAGKSRHEWRCARRSIQTPRFKLLRTHSHVPHTSVQAWTTSADDLCMQPPFELTHVSCIGPHTASVCSYYDEVTTDFGSADSDRIEYLKSAPPSSHSPVDCPPTPVANCASMASTRRHLASRANPNP
jgi:hypothetical protein